ncbi:IucA/IucC family protein [Streptomyces sp. NPDC001107]
MTAPTVTDTSEAELLTRVLGALLREDVVGLRSRSTLVHRPDGDWLRLPTTEDALLLPVTEDGYQCEHRARLPLLVRESDNTELISYEAVLGALRELAEPVDRDGFDAFAEECRQTLDTLRLHAQTRDEVDQRLVDRYGDDPARWTGLAYDTLAARLDHPVYPTARGRSGLSEEQLRAYAPEFHPRFALRWLAVPRETVTLTGPLPQLWPSPARLGLPEVEQTHVALPVHPLTVGAPLDEALRTTGLTGRALLVEQAHLEVVPTLSMRTVAVAADPSLHLKLPLATATLGLRNKRSIKPGTLVDGAAGQRLVEAVIAREPRFRDTILHADETTYAHAGHELLAVLCRRFPAGLEHSVVVPLAALLAEAPGGRLVLDHLADRFYGGDPLALLDACLSLLFDWQTTLFGYGIALESHQQNISLVLGPGSLRLLFKDNDGPRINASRLAAVLPGPWGFDDRRTFTAGDGPVADVFATITVHLCAGAYAFGLAKHRDALLTLVRERLAEAVDRLGGEAGAVLRAHVLDAPRLPVKAMVTAGTLLSKERSGAADVNKHYTSGPNYLLPDGGSA